MTGRVAANRRRPDRGSGALSTTFGMAVFLMSLMFCSHVLLNLWLVSSVDAVAHDAATDVATSGATDGELAGVEREASARARSELGAIGDRVGLEFEDGGPDEIVLHVTAPELDLLPPFVAALAGRHGIDRRIVVEREEPNP
ncbi:MAG: hypothetical protein U0Q22_03880 [Acidimicrobiales bacterium]